jgi:hypothetical protein
MSHNLKVVLLTLLLIVLVLFGPFFTLWSLNTLFPVLAIPYTLETWAATIILGGFFKTTINKK